MGELAYVLVNPHTIYKSRTGGVLGRLLSRSATIRIAGVRMFAPSAALVNEYAAALAEEHSDAPDAQEVDRLIHEYVLNHYMPGPDGRPGYGGKCFPKDVNAFTALCRGTGLHELLEPLKSLNIRYRGEDG